MMFYWLLSAAMAGPCHEDGMPAGPVSGSVFDGNLGSARRACVRDEVGLAQSAYLLADAPAFYGHIVAGTVADLSLTASDDVAIFARLEMIRYDSVISAISSSYLGPGHTSVGASYRLLHSDKLAGAVHGQLVLPTAFGLYRHSWPFAMDAGFSMQYAISKPFEFHNDVVLLGSGAASLGPTQVRIGAMEHVGIGWRPGRAFAWVIDARAGFGYRAPLDHVAAATSFRFSDGKRFGFDTTFTVPLAGFERALVTADLRATVRLGPMK
jgi:hypothetical protein